MFCTHCGVKIEGNTLYCPNCGEKLPSRETKNPFPQWLRWLVALAFIGLLFSLYFFFIEPEPQSTITEQLNALKKRQYTEAYYGSTSHDFQEATSLEKFKDVIHAFPYLARVKDIKILQEDIQNSVATLKVALTSDDNYQFVMEYQLVKDEGKWKILYFKLLKETTQPAPADSDPEEVIRDELKLLKNSEIEKAYHSTTSKEFQSTTTLAQFENFVTSNPLLVNYQSYFPEPIEKVEDMRRVVYVLKGEKEEKHLEYSLVQEEGAWKILGIKILLEKPLQEPLRAAPPSNMTQEDYLQLIQNFLTEVGNGNLQKAWQEYTTDAFKKAAPLEQFKTIISSYDFFKNYKAMELSNLNLLTKIASLRAQLQSKQGKVGNVQFDILRENGKLKIQQILIFKAEKSLQFEQILVSDKATFKGEVISPSGIIKNPRGTIYVNLLVLNVTKGDFITLTLSNPSLKIKSPPIEHVVKNSAKNYIAYFSFAPPTAGWPTGTYLIEAKSESGENRTFNFLIE